MKFKKLFMVLMLTCLSINFLAIPASANEYHVNFGYYVLDRATGKYVQCGTYYYSSADASSRSYDIYGKTFESVGYNYAPAEYRNTGYTYTSSYTYSSRADVCFR